MQSNTSVINVNSTESATPVEICGKLSAPSLAQRGAAPQALLRGPRRISACSACAGDYEDPDRTAWVNVEDEVGPQADGEEFPAEE